MISCHGQLIEQIVRQGVRFIRMSIMPVKYQVNIAEALRRRYILMRLRLISYGSYD
jgi:hypothetical protein